MSLDVNKMTKDQLRQHILMLAMQLTQLEKENKKLKEYNWELIENHKKDVAILCEENKKLKEEVKDLVERNIELDKKYMLVLTENKKLREELSAYDREFRDEDKKAEHIFMEEDTLQELRDLGEI